jgi:alpha-L-fucosidase 2
MKPASVWEEALPVGNGRLGAMIFGGVPVERIQFNEETLWTGKPRDYSHPGASGHLAAIRELLWEGRQKEAGELAMETFMSVPLRQEKYQPFGDLWISFPGHELVEGYERELDISNATCKTRYKAGEATFTREYFASSPDNVIVVRLDADKKNSLSPDIWLTSLHEGYSVVPAGDGVIEMNVQVKNGAISGVAMVKVRAEGGTVTTPGGKIHIEKANRVTLFLAAATSFINPRKSDGDPAVICREHFASIGGKKFESLRRRHVADYSGYFNRFSIDLGGPYNGNVPTDERIKAIPSGMDNSLAALYVQYGRYLMLASGRPGTYPANLQGIWNDKLEPAWGSKYTVNINTEMNYWPVEALNLAECHESLFRMVSEIVPAGEKVAREHYNARGWVLHHNTDIWRGAAPINASDHGIWVSGSGWLAHHYWEHFLHGRDKHFLETVAWPVMKGAALFYVDFLVADPATGWLVSTPSNSPENGGLVAGPTMDHEIIKSLFKACIEAATILNSDAGFADTLEALLPAIAPYRVGRFGQLREWMDDIDDPGNKHRHVSHLWGVYPGKEINREETPALMEAARKSLVARGDEGTGWSLAWKINFWARFLEGNHAWKMVQMLLRPAGEVDLSTAGGGSAGGGSYPNLFDAHPPFQVDGNFGGAAGIAEMLVQSHLGTVDILPALPDGIPEGSVKGFRAREAFELEFSWSGGKLTFLEVNSKEGCPLSLRYKDKIFTSPTRKGQKLKFNGYLEKI